MSGSPDEEDRAAEERRSFEAMEAVIKLDRDTAIECTRQPFVALDGSKQMALLQGPPWISDDGEMLIRIKGSSRFLLEHAELDLGAIELTTDEATHWFGKHFPHKRLPTGFSSVFPKEQPARLAKWRQGGFRETSALGSDSNVKPPALTPEVLAALGRLSPPPLIIPRKPRVDPALPRGAPGVPAEAGSAPKRPKRPGGRPSDTDPKEDRRVAEAWRTGQYATYEQLANAIGKERRDVKLAIDRDRKRTGKRGSGKSRQDG
jgi:hypothetical protein